MLDEVRNTTLTILNKNNFGSLNVSDFNRLAKLAQLQIFNGYVKAYNELVNMQNSMMSGEEYADRLAVVQLNIENFLVFDENITEEGEQRVLKLPSMDRTSSVLYKVMELKLYMEEVLISIAEKVTPGIFNASKISYIEEPTVDFPVYMISGDTILTQPSVLDLRGGYNWKVDYLRMPKDPKWTYITLSGGHPIFDPTANDFQDLEIGQDDFPRIVRLICEFAGLVIRDRDVVQYMAAKDQQEEQKK